MLVWLVVAMAANAATENIVLAGEVVCRIADPGPYGSVQRRAAQIDKRICEALSIEDVGNPKMWVAQRNGLWSVFIGKTYLISVYPGDTRLYGKPAYAVASYWASRFKHLFPLAEPVTKMMARRAQAGERRPAGTKPRIPKQMWGLVDRFLVLLEKMRSVDCASRRGQEEVVAEVMEAIALNWYAPPPTAFGHEPGTCLSIRRCPECRRAMEQALNAGPKRPLAMQLKANLLADAGAVRAVRQCLAYVRRVDAKRYKAERVRIAWALIRRLRARAAALAPRQPMLQGAGCAAAR